MDGVPRFRDVTSEAGLPDVVPVKCPHVEIQDFDNDGRPDLYFSAAWANSEGTDITPLVFRNVGTRDDVPQLRAPHDVAEVTRYYPAGPTADFDGDGRLDVLLINWFQQDHCRLLRNESAARHWLDVQVTGRTFIGMGIGSQIRIYESGGLRKREALLGVQEVSIGYGYASGQPAICHFGLGSHVRVDVEVTLPNRRRVERVGVEVDRRLIVVEP